MRECNVICSEKEHELDEVVERDDYDTAEKLNGVIERIKAKLNM